MGGPRVSCYEVFCEGCGWSDFGIKSMHDYHNDKCPQCGEELRFYKSQDDDHDCDGCACHD